MKQDACILNIDNLRTWFELNQSKDEGRPYFTVYRGTEAKPDRVVFRNTDVDDSARAWEMLQEILEMHTEHGGVFRIFITPKPMYNNGMSTLYKVPSPFGQMGGSLGIHGTQMGFGGMYGSLAEAVKAEIEKEKRVWELEMRLRDMEAEKDAKIGQFDSYFQEFLPVLKDLAHRVGVKMISGGTPPQQPPPAAAVGTAAPSYSEEGYDYETLEPALDDLRTIFPNTEEVISRIARFAKENPDAARAYLGQL